MSKIYCSRQFVTPLEPSQFHKAPRLTEHSLFQSLYICPALLAPRLEQGYRQHNEQLGNQSSNDSDTHVPYIQFPSPLHHTPTSSGSGSGSGVHLIIIPFIFLPPCRLAIASHHTATSPIVLGLQFNKPTIITCVIR